MKTISIRINDLTEKQIQDLKEHDLIKKFNCNTSDIIRIAIREYWLDMCTLGFGKMSDKLDT